MRVGGGGPARAARGAVGGGARAARPHARADGAAAHGGAPHALRPVRAARAAAPHAAARAALQAVLPAGDCGQYTVTGYTGRVENSLARRDAYVLFCEPDNVDAKFDDDRLRVWNPWLVTRLLKTGYNIL